MPLLRITTESGSTSIEASAEASVLKTLLAADIRLRAPCGGIGECGLCRIRIEGGDVNQPTPTEQGRLTEDELEKGMRLACQVRLLGDAEITVEVPPPVSGWTGLEDMEDVEEAGDGILGVAVDLGTSQIRVALWNLETKTRIAGRCGPNPQADLGTDVLTRLLHCLDSGKGAREMAWLARGAIGEALSDIAAHSSIDLRNVRQVVVVANTAMLCMLADKHQDLLLNPEYWTREIDYAPDETASWTAPWGVNPAATVKLAAPLAGFVGADFLAAVCATRLTEEVPNSLLIDFGSNSEIGLWDGQTLWASSAPCGPSFEAAGIRCGMTASSGAIYRFERTDTVGKYRFEVVDGGEPRGICGSGLVDAIACLLEEGRLDRKGRLVPPVGPEGVPMAGGRKTIALHQRDIDVFQRAKSAISAAIDCLLQRSDTQARDLQRICVCGMFGRFMDIAHARSVGLIPPAECVELHANAALSGCELLLLCGGGAERFETLKKKTKIINMAEDPEHDERFIQHLRF